MTPDSENFEQLRKLIALKRHEMPPPGYFHGFSREVIVRIKAGETGQTTSSWWVMEGSWLRRFWSVFETRPVLAGGFGVAVCGFFVAGALISADNPQVVGVGIAEPALQPAEYSQQTTAQSPALDRVSDQFPSSNPGALSGAVPARSSLFDQIQQVKAQTVSYPWQAAPVGGN